MSETSFKKAITDIDWLKSPMAIMIAYRGSIAHGMYVPQSNPSSIDDKDIMSIVIPDLEYYFGLKTWGSHGTKELMKNEWDCVGYELKKFVSLLTKGNPNVLSLLWLTKQDYIHLGHEGQLLIENRDLFSSKQAYHSFVGYAHGQLHRMTHHTFEGYMGAKRKALVEKVGYDSKNAAHLIRLLRMGIEFLNEGILYVKRQDASQLLEIKCGEWTLEQVKHEADFLFKQAQIAYLNSKLPNDVNHEKINKLLIEIFQSHFYENK